MLTKPTNSYIKVGKINLARSKTATEEIGIYARKHGIDILILQEPYVKSNRVVDLSVGQEWRAFKLVPHGRQLWC